jgi:hypothetical protein
VFREVDGMKINWVAAKRGVVIGALASAVLAVASGRGFEGFLRGALGAVIGVAAVVVLHLLVRMFQRPPDFVIGNPKDPYIHRWYLIPRNSWCNLYLHHILRSDDDRALHDHPWWFISIVLWRGYREITTLGTWWRWPLSIALRWATLPHRIELDKPAWTLVITGPRVRDWGFHCPKGWVHWEQFVDHNNHGNVGRGCE